MLQPVYKQDAGTRGERLLSRLAEDAFFSLWSYPSVHRRSGSTKHPVIKEVADLLVLFENQLILVSEKDKHFSSSAPNDTAWQRWARESVTESAAQLISAEKHITTRGEELFLDRRAEHPFPLDIDRAGVRVHLIALCRNVKASKWSRAPDLTAETGNGLIFQADVNIGAGSPPFVVGDLDTAKPFVHVLDEEAFELLVNELGTVADLLHYLTAREQAIRIEGLKQFSHEGTLLASYLTNLDDHGRGSIRLRAEISGGRALAADVMTWSSFIVSSVYQERWSFYQRAARPWNDIAARFSNAIMQAHVGEEASDGTLASHEAALRLWASENLFSRAFLALQLFEKYEQVPTNARSSRLVPSRCRPERVYVFLFVPWSDDYSDYKFYRRERLACMTMYAHAASLVVPQFKEIVVLGADPKGSARASEAIMGLQVDEPPVGEAANRIRKMMVEHRVLTDFLTAPMPIATSAGSSGRAARRVRPNDQCSCGSGVKFKRCCGVKVRTT